MGDKNKYSKQYRIMLLTYLACIMIPLVIFVLGYIYTYHSIKEDTSLYHETILNQQKYNYDKMFIAVTKSLNIVSRDDLIISLMEKEEWNNKDLFDVVSIKELLNETIIENDLNNLNIYFSQNQSFISEENRYAPQVMETFLGKYGLKLDQFLAETKGLSGYYLINSKGMTEMVIYKKVFDPSYKHSQAIAFSVLKWSDLSEIAELGSGSATGGIALIDSSGALIGASNPDVFIEGEEISNLLKEESYVNEVDLGQTPFIVSINPSDVADVYYAIYTPKSIFYKKANYFKIAIIMEVLLSALVGALASVYFVRKNYGPINRILSLLDTEHDYGEDETVRSLYQDMEKSIRHKLLNEKELQNKLSQWEHQIAGSILSAMMKGKVLTESWTLENEDTFKNSVDINRFCIVLFAFEDVSDNSFIGSQNSEDDYSVYSLMLFSIKNVLNEMLLQDGDGDSLSGTIVEVDDMVSCIVPQREDDEITYLNERIQLSLGFLKEAFGIKASVGVSDYHSGWDSLSEAYDEALMTVMHTNFWGKDVEDVVYYRRELKDREEKTKESHLLEKGQLLVNCLTVRDYKQASLMLDDIIENCFSKDIEKMSVNRSQGAFLVGLVMNNLEEVLKEEEFKTNIISFTDDMNKVGSLHKLSESLHGIIERIADMYEKEIKSSEPVWLQDVMEYMEAHYCESDINISSIADQFNMSLSHLGKVYKKYTGKSMLDQIHKLRIEECKNLLQQDCTIKECAQATGYLDSKALIRAFKRYEGVTPGQYKKRFI